MIYYSNIPFLFLFVVLLGCNQSSPSSVMAFQTHHSFSQTTRSSTTTATTTTTTTTQLPFNPFKGFVDSMESGYAGGEESPYSKIKQRDAEKRQAELDAYQEKRAKGFKKLSDVQEKTFVQPKYDQPEEEEKQDDVVSKWAKETSQKVPGFKFPWEN